MPTFKDKQDFCNQTKVASEKNYELIEFAKNNLNNLPFTPEDGEKWENYERMISGMLYNCMQKELEIVRMNVRDLILDYGNFRTGDYKSIPEFYQARTDFLKKFIGHVGEDTFMEYPARFDYGFNTYLGKRFYSNYNLTILDVAIVRIGDYCMCGPNVSIVTPCHPLNPSLRWDPPLENALPITIGDNVWLCADCTIIGGVTIGDGCVIAAGSVVTKDIPANSLVAGVPGRVIKQLEPRDPSFNIHETIQKYGMGYIE
ncbi:unnamed protein product [Candida verbasci]|uniref:Maltose/galactoside acetyltransferase domain-containing protein n=1 Tax=Candida verbasci TaxID=1227364 RepID=A0A9W4XDD0_9ASCO|nr:unnamed protein product [Candida verbasci]